ncbi:electron transfer flavoprotein subunit beta/FixA family protein [Corynebacterium sp. Q4381]|uniref:electron transfer flavoprotein subunit beta/FixA family protein n=1 Tax=Corynebacterium sp. Marseille-Q4381 TaxID=3121597 RepID=UPI002FE5E3E5
MRIAVLLKEVPDTYSDREMSLETGLTDRTGDVVADEVGERAVEAALRIKEAREGDAEVHILTVGPESAADAVRRGIAMGASEGFLLSDVALTGADLTLTAEALAAMVEKNGYDLVVCGAMSSDGAAGVMAPMLAELLNWPALTNLSELALDGESVVGVGVGEGGVVKLQAPLPAVAAVSDEFPDARFPNFKGLMAAKKKELHTFALAELGIDAEDYSRPRAIMVDVAKRPARERGEIIDGGKTAASQLVDFLDSRGLL